MPKQPPTCIELPEQMPGENDRDYYRRCAAWLRGEDVRTVTDLRDFKTADFTLAPSRDSN